MRNKARLPEAFCVRSGLFPLGTGVVIRPSRPLLENDCDTQESVTTTVFGLEMLEKIVHIKWSTRSMKTASYGFCLALLLSSLTMHETLALGQLVTNPTAGKTKEAVLVKRGTQVLFHLQQPISSANAHNGEPVKLVVQEDVQVDGVIVIPKGAEGMGVVFDAMAAIPGKRDGMLMIRPVDLTLPDGRHIKMSDNPPGYEECDDPIFGPCWLEYSLFAPIVLPLKLGDKLADRHHTAEGNDVTQTTTELVQGYTRQRFTVENNSRP